MLTNCYGLYPQNRCWCAVYAIIKTMKKGVILLILCVGFSNVTFADMGSMYMEMTVPDTNYQKPYEVQKPKEIDLGVMPQKTYNLEKRKIENPEIIDDEEDVNVPVFNPLNNGLRNILRPDM